MYEHVERADRASAVFAAVSKDSPISMDLASRDVEVEDGLPGAVP